MVLYCTEGCFEADFFGFLPRFFSLLAFQEAANRKFDLRAPAGGEQVKFPRFAASRKANKLKNRG